MAILYSTLIFLFVSPILWYVLRRLSFVRLIHQIQYANKIEWCKIILGFLKKRSERNVFYRFMAMEVGLAGILPPFISAQISLKCQTTEVHFWVNFIQNSDSVSIVVAIMIAIGYGLYLWLTNKKNPQEWQDVVTAAKLINDEYNFVPNQKWLETQNDNAIVSLGKRYSKTPNYPYKDMAWALASMSYKDEFLPLLQDDLQQFTKTVYSVFKHSSNQDDMFQKVLGTCKTLLTKIHNLDGSVDAYLQLLDSLKSFLRDVEDLYYEMSREKRTSKYTIQQLQESTRHLITKLSNEWIMHKQHPILFITGEAGCGKSHLIGDLVSHRKDKGLPSLLILGQHLNTQANPLSQIRDLLDIKCKNANWLQQLNSYGQNLNVPVVIFIDAINEGGGEELWHNFMDQFLLEFNKYAYIRLVISFRISQRQNWFYDFAHHPKNAVYFHYGFQGQEQEASKFLFESFGLDQPLWPMYSSEFSNPLFLLQYCRNHERSGAPLFLEDFWTTITTYCNQTNHELAIKFQYNDAKDLVTEAMRTIAQLMVENDSRWNLEYDVVIASLIEIAKYTPSPQLYIDILIDEGLIRIERYNRHTYVNYGFERIGDYFIAEYLILHESPEKWLNEEYGDLLEPISVLAPQMIGKEAWELMNEQNDVHAMQNGFIISSVWREQFSESGRQLLTKFIETKEYNTIFSIILDRPFREDTAANALTLRQLLWDMSMAERDAIWTTKISWEGGLGRNLLSLAQWGTNASDAVVRRLSDTTARLCIETLIWSFSATRRELRDTATHAVVNILKNKSSLILPILEDYYSVTDFYIQERLWAGVYGALLLAQNNTLTQQIGEWVYINIFSSNQVPEHILIREYAKNIVLFAQHQGWQYKVNEKLIRAPFTKGIFPAIPSNKDISRRFEREWDTIPENERESYRAQDAIYSSMATEFAERGYGDFGRYVFQAYIHGFGENVELMSNWATVMIFDEFHYEPRIFAQFDNKHSSYDRTRQPIERIGKKYQWIALYRIIALLMDRHPDKDWSQEIFNPIYGIRNIDPTMYQKSNRLILDSIYHLPKYNIKKIKDDKKWVKAWKDMPKIHDYVEHKEKEGTRWINLYAYNKYQNTIDDVENLSQMVRQHWTFIQAYVCDKKDLKKICANLYKIGIQGRSFHENKEIYDVFSREFYWSDIYQDATPTEYYHRVPFEVGRKSFPNIITEPTYLEYILSSESDSSMGDAIGMLLPNEWIFKELKLQYSSENGSWINASGEVIVFDNSYYTTGESALLIKKDVLLEYLNTHDKCLFWPILNERMVYSHDISYSERVQCGGWAYMDKNGKIHQHLRSYETPQLVHLWISIKNKMAKKMYALRLKINGQHDNLIPAKINDLNGLTEDEKEIIRKG